MMINRTLYAAIVIFCTVVMSDSAVALFGVKKTSSKSSKLSKFLPSSNRVGITGSTVSGAFGAGSSLNPASVNPVGAVANVKTKTTGNTTITLDGAAFTPGATIAVGSQNALMGGNQAIGSMFGNNNSAAVSGFSSNAPAVTKAAVSGINSKPASAVLNSSNVTQGDFTFNMNSGGGMGGVGSLDLQNGATVTGGITQVGTMAGTQSNIGVTQ